MKIGVFGGSFNPPHLGHKQIVESLLSTKLVDKVIIVPVGNDYQKKDLVDASYRYQMLRMMFEGNNQVEVSRYEIDRKHSYTYETLAYLIEVYPNDELYFILGKDNMFELETWKNSELLKRTYSFLVIDRRVSSIKNSASIPSNMLNRIDANIKIKDISSTRIRKQLKTEKDKAQNDLDKKVYQYILKHGLYK